MDQPGEYRIVLDSDWSEFGGHSRRDKNTTSHTYKEGHVGKRCHMLTYLPSRTAVVFERVGSSCLMEDLVLKEEEDCGTIAVQENRPSVQAQLPPNMTIDQPIKEVGKAENNLVDEIPAHFL